MASSLFGGAQKPNPLQSAMQAVNMMRNANPEQVMHQMMQSNPQFAEFINAICSLGYQTLDQTSKLGSTIQQDFNQTQAQLAECCCTAQRGIDSVNYNGAINTAAIQQTVTEQTQKVLDTITGNRMADMQNQINQLQLSQALCGVVRYPNTFAYNAGPSPFCGNSCCGTANI